MGELFGGGKTSSTQTSSSQPWAPQANALQGAFGQASTIEGNRLRAGAYQGNYVAGETPYQSSTYALGQGIQTGLVGTGGDFLNDGFSLANASGGANLQNAMNLEAGGLGTTANPALMAELEGYGTGTGAQGSLSAALNSAAVNGAGAVQAGQGTLNQVAQQGLSNQTNNLAASAQQYMNSGATQQALGATNAAIDQTLAEGTLPGQNRSEALEGNMNSSRAGAAQAAAQGQSAIAKGSADAAIENNAYNTGLSTALGAYTSGLGAASTAGANEGYIGNSTALGAGSQQISAANSGLSQNLGYAQDNFSDQLAGNSQIANAENMGLNWAGTGANLIGSGYGIGNSSAQGQQTAAQNALTNQYDQWSGQNTYSQNVLNNYIQDISGNYGQTTTGTSSVQQPENVLGSLAGLGLAGASLYGSGAFGGLFAAGAPSAAMQATNTANILSSGDLMAAYGGY